MRHITFDVAELPGSNGVGGDGQQHGQRPPVGAAEAAEGDDRGEWR